MKSSTSRGRLLAGAALGFGLALVPQQAQAACVVTATTVVCDDTTTADSTNAGGTPALDRHYPANTSAADFTGTVNTGEIVDGFGLAFTNTVGGANDLNVVNNGTIQINAGNTATAGGNDALDITAIGATNVNYSGTGDIINLGTTGSAFQVNLTGTGDLVANIGGDLRSAVGGSNDTGNGLFVDQSGAGGNVAVTTATGTTVQADWVGLLVQGNNALSTGDLSITNNAAVGSLTGAPNTLFLGVGIEHVGLGDTTVVNNGAIGSTTDRVQSIGVYSQILNGASTGAMNLSGTGAIFSSGIGLMADNDGSGTTTINYTGAIDTTGSIGVLVDSSNGGAVNATLGAVTATGGVAVDVNQTDAAGTGAVLLTTSADVAGSTDAILIDNAGTGAVTVDVDGSVAADAGDAIRVTSTNAAAGAIGITTLAGETIEASGGDGIEVDTAGTGAVGVINAANILSGAGGVGTLQDGINVTTTGTGGITINNTGNIGAAGDEAQLTGITAAITNAGSDGDISVAGTGDIVALGNGIDAETLGTGDVSVVYGGDVTSDGARAISAVGTTGTVTITSGGVVTNNVDGSAAIFGETTTGALNITVNGDASAPGLNTAGVNAQSTTGAQTIAINADVDGATGLVTSTTGTRAITIGAGGSVNGTTGAIRIDNTGAATITNAGSIGTLVTDQAILVTAGADTTVTNQAGGTITGDITLGAADDTITNAGTMVAGDLNFGAGADLLTNQAGGTLTVAGATPILGLETFNNAGTVTAATGLTFDAGATALTNTGTLNAQGTLDFGDGADSFANSGTGIFNLTGATTLAGLETFTNSGRINLNTFVLTGPAVAFNNTGTIDTSGSAGLAGFTTFSNAGTLDLAAGTFTVPAAVFTNTGTILADEGATTITGQTSFANSGTIDLQDGAVGDVLTINSAFVGSGGSNLDVDFTGTASDRLVITGAASGTTAVDAAYLGGGFNLDGVLVVDTASSSANAFVLGAVTGETPLLDVSLVQAGADYFLVAAPTAAAFNPLVVPGFATDLWYQSADEVFAETVKPATTSGISFWGEGYYSREKYGDSDDSIVVDGLEFEVDNELKTKRYGLQMGVDYGFDGARIGLTGGYGWAKANGNADADLKAKGWNIGVYGQFGGLTGFHGEFLAKHDRYDAEFDDGVFDGEEFDIRSTGVDGSLGYRFGFGGGATMDIHGGLSHVRTKVDDIGAFGFNYDIEKLTSTRGRLGARAIFGGSLSPYIDGTVYREFDGDGEIELFDGTAAYDLDTEGKGTWVRLEAGLSGNDGPGPILAAFGDFGDRKGFGVRAGWRLGGAAVAAAPPPPPPAPYVAPPAPPPPATQTCPDGSVILATDMCPPPPPPPPPPPEPERG
jgi:hypothetical protein